MMNSTMLNVGDKVKLDYQMETTIVGTVTNTNVYQHKKEFLTPKDEKGNELKENINVITSKGVQKVWIKDLTVCQYEITANNGFKIWTRAMPTDKTD